VGLILDLAVAALALLVIASLAMLAWTLGISATRATRERRRQVEEDRRSIARTEERIRSGARRASAKLAELAARTTPTPGERPDA